MVENGIFPAGQTHAVKRAAVAQANPHEARDQVASRKSDGRARDGDALSRSGLPGDSRKGMAADKTVAQSDHAGDLEEDRSRSDIRRAGFAERTFAGIVQVRHVDDLSAATSHRHAPVAFCTVKGQASGLELPHVSRRDRSTGIHLVDAPIVGLERSRFGDLEGGFRLLAAILRALFVGVRNGKRIRSQIDAVPFDVFRGSPGERKRSVLVRRVHVPVARERRFRLCRRIGNVQFERVQGDIPERSAGCGGLERHRGRRARSADRKCHVSDRRVFRRERAIRGSHRELPFRCDIDVDIAIRVGRGRIDIVQVEQKGMRSRF